MKSPSPPPSPLPSPPAPLPRAGEGSETPTIGIIGVGNMGGGMAKRLLSLGYSVKVCDIDPIKTQALQALGANVAPDPASVAACSEVIIICVVDAAQCADVTRGISKQLGSDPNSEQGADLGSDPNWLALGPNNVISGVRKTVLFCPTIAPSDTEHLAQTMMDKGFDVIDCPMSGGPARAQQGTMSLMVACAAGVFERNEALLNDLANPVFKISARVGDGARTKLVNNLLAGINFAGAAQVMALAQRVGLDLQTTLDVMQASSAQSWISGDRMSRAIAGDYAPRAHMTLLAKDTALALQMAHEVGFTSTVGQPASKAFADAVDSGMGGVDDAALLTYFLNQT